MVPDGPGMAPVWPRYGPVMSPLWPRYGPVMAPLWPRYGPGYGPGVAPYGPGMAPKWPRYVLEMAPLWPGISIEALLCAWRFHSSDEKNVIAVVKIKGSAGSAVESVLS